MQPAAIVPQVGVVDIRADVKGVVGLQQLPPTRIDPAQDGPGQEHADGFAADEAGADDALPDGDQVAQIQVLLRQGQDPFLAAENHLGQGAEDLLGLVPHVLAALQPLPDPLGVEEGPVPLAQPKMHRIQPRPGLGGEDLGDGGTVGDGREAVAFPDMEHVHGRRIAVLHLGGLDIDLALVAVNLGEDLSGAGDGPGGLGGVGVAQQGEVGQGLQVEDVGAGEHEEIAQHAIAGPGLGQGREAVEDEEGPAPGLADLGAHLGDEALETDGDIDLPHLPMVGLPQQGRMIREAEVDQPAALLVRRPAIGRDQGGEIGDVVQMPDQVVPGQQATEDAIQGGDAGAEVGFDHAVTCGARGAERDGAEKDGNLVSGFTGTSSRGAASGNT